MSIIVTGKMSTNKCEMLIISKNVMRLLLSVTSLTPGLKMFIKPNKSLMKKENEKNMNWSKIAAL